MSEVFCTWDTDLRLWDILYIWHRSGVLRYSSRRHRHETLSFLACVTQTWESKIFCTYDTGSEIFWDILHSWHRTEDLRFSLEVTQISRTAKFNMEDTDLKTWDIQYGRHRSKIWYFQRMRHKSQDLRYSMLNTTLKLWDIQYAKHRSQDLRYSARQTQYSVCDEFLV